MFIRKPFIALVFFIGTGLLLLFSVSYIWMPLIQNNQLLMAIAEVMAIVLCLMAVCFGIFYFIAKKNQHSEKGKDGLISRLPRSISQLPSKDGDSSTSAIPMTG